MIASARSGKKTGPGRPRSTAITSAKTRMNTSQTRKIFTFSTNARAMSGNELEMSPQSKNAFLTSGQPGDCVTATTTTDEDGCAQQRDRDAPRALGLEAQPAEQARAARRYFSIGAPVAFASHCC